MDYQTKFKSLKIGRYLFSSRRGRQVYATSDPKIWAWTLTRGINGKRYVYAIQKRYNFKDPPWGT